MEKQSEKIVDGSTPSAPNDEESKVPHKIKSIKGGLLL